VHQVLHSFARSDLNDAVRELAAQKKPGRADLLYRKSIRMGGLIEQGLIDLAAVRTALYEASVHNGLVAENGKQDVLRNIERGFVYCATKAQEASSAAIGFATIIFCGDGGQRADADALETRSDQRPSDDALLNELANLSYIEYARRRPEAAQTLGIPLSFLDKEVEKRRSKLDGRDWEQPLFDHWAVEPWPELVDGDALILSLVRRLRSHVVMSCEAALTVALWITLTWVHADAAVNSPILMITSPEAACGKTTLLGIIGFLAKQALSSVSISPAVLYRAIERWSPCLIIDEADTAFDENEELRAVVNSGWTRGQGVLRCDGEEHEPRLFATFCPKAIGVKGKKLPDTTSSRSIIIELKRKIADETVKDFRHVDDPELVELRQKLLRWSMDNRAELLKANPQLPNGFINRVAANWLLPLAIADVAGGEWPDKAREAAALISQEERNSSIGTQLLADIQAAFGDNDDRLFSSTLVDKLTADPEAPWATYNRGKELTQKQLANRLKDYRIVSETVWIAGKSAKGYKRSAFEDAWLRYLSD
jgi:putative DNA primase/helicase